LYRTTSLLIKLDKEQKTLIKVILDKGFLINRYCHNGNAYAFLRPGMECPAVVG